MDDLDKTLYFKMFGGHYTKEEEEAISNRIQKRELEFDHILENLHTAKIFSLTWFKLLFIEYKTVYGGKKHESLVCWNGMSALDGCPAFIVKEYKGKYYNLKGLSNPGFPGN